jgi:hypothetical protein
VRDGRDNGARNVEESRVGLRDSRSDRIAWDRIGWLL